MEPSTGLHNLVVGKGHNYQSYGGTQNIAAGALSSVSGEFLNTTIASPAMPPELAGESVATLLALMIRKQGVSFKVNSLRLVRQACAVRPFHRGGLCMNVFIKLEC
jgi:hypothetical protein